MERNQNRGTVVRDMDELEETARLRQIEHSFDEVASLAKSEVSSQRFAERFLHDAVRTVSAVGGAVWEFDHRGVPRCAQALNLECLRLANNSEAETSHARLVGSMLQSSQGKVVPPHTAAAADDLGANPTDYSLLLQPLMLADAPTAVLELVIAPAADARRERAAVEIADSLAELASEFYTRDALRRSKNQAQTLGELDVFVRQIHQNRQLGPTAVSVVNQARRFLDCDRVSLVLDGRRGYALQAVSGVETVNRRSNAARRLEDLAKCAIARGEAVYGSDETQRSNDELKQKFDSYRDESPTSDLAILPLVWSIDGQPAPGQRALGAVIVENFEEKLPESLRLRGELVRTHSAIALQQAMLGQRTLLRSVLRQARFTKGFVMLAMAALVVASLIFVPADFSIEARGKLEPRLRRDIFAPSPGIVRNVRVSHSQKVNENEVLVELENPALELEHERLKGEAQTVRKRISALEATRGTQGTTEGGPVSPGLIVAQQEELKERLANLELQKKLIETQRESLVLKSPLTGEVITWKPDDLLKDRPIERGQRMLTVAAPQGPWQIELLIPDQSVGHVLDAYDRFGSELRVTYILATDPNRTYETTIESIAASSEVHEDQQPYVLATVAVGKDDVASRRPGTTVFARLHCGRRPLGYVWLRELFETIQRHFVL